MKKKKVNYKEKVKEINSNQSYGITVMRDGTSHNESRKVENAVLGSEIKKLTQGEIFFGDIEGNWTKIQVAYDKKIDAPKERFTPHIYCENLIIAPEKTTKKQLNEPIQEIQTTPIKGDIWS